jgi:hypothetical protein
VRTPDAFQSGELQRGGLVVGAGSSVAVFHPVIVKQTFATSKLRDWRAFRRCFKAYLLRDIGALIALALEPAVYFKAMAHPLSDFVLSAFTPENGHHDKTTIACFMAGATFISIPKSKKNAMEAYLLVAADVLGCLVEDGRLQVDPVGWHIVKSA